MAARTRLTLDEFLAMPGIDERRLELIDGEVYEKASPRWGHSRIAAKLAAWFSEIGYAGVEPRAIIPPGATDGPSAPLPDVAFCRSDPPADDEWTTRPPDVAVEMRSLGQRRSDIRVEVDLCLRFGVSSVWVVDLESRAVEVYEAGARRVLSGVDVVESVHAPGMRFAVAEPFER